MQTGVLRKAGAQPRRIPAIKRAARAALLFAALATPLSASSAQDNARLAPETATSTEAGMRDTAPQNAANDRTGERPFSAHFVEVIEPLGPNHVNVDLAVPPSAVDLDTFEPPIEQDVVQRDLGAGVASYYGRRFHGRRTANGERFDMRAMTAAHRTLPFGSMVRVTNPRTGQSVTVRINDRGPFARGRTIDLSRAAAEEIGLIRRGHGTVELELLAP